MRVAEEPNGVAERLADAAQRRGLRLAVAESLTGGELSAKLAAAPGASEWFRGGLVAYAREVKYDVLGVPRGPVVSEVAATTMADGVADLLGADVTVAVTGVAGPDEQDGQPPGTVWMALHDAAGTTSCLHRFEGEPAQVVDATCDAALAWLLDRCER
jgi:nicotinamide-nucleotide amidase